MNDPTRSNSADRPLSGAIRKNRARKALPKWIAALQATLGVEIDAKNFLEAEETVELKRAFYNRVKTADFSNQIEWAHDKRKDAIRFLASCGRRVGRLNIILFSSKDTILGAVVVPAAAVLSKAEGVWSLTNEDLSLTTPDLEHGLCLEFNYHDSRGGFVPEGAYLLTLWGIFSEEPKQN